MNKEHKRQAVIKVKNLVQHIKNRDFSSKSSAEIRSDMIAEYIFPIQKRGHKGPEYIFEKKIGIRTIFICTSLLKNIDDINDTDYIWIGMKTLGNSQKFFWFPLLRLGNFDEDSIGYIDAFIELAEKWPECTKCNQEFELLYYPGVMHLMEFNCINSKCSHRLQKHVPYAVFDVPELSDKSANVLFKRYEKFYEAEYRRQQQNPDKVPMSARVLRSMRKKEDQARYHAAHNQYGDMKDTSDGRYFDGPHNDGF